MQTTGTVRVNAPNVTYTDATIESRIDYTINDVVTDASGNITVTPTSTPFQFQTDRKVPRLGVMLVGWGGNNGSTVTASVIANRERMSWRTRQGVHYADYFGSVTQCSTVRLGYTKGRQEVCVPFNTVVPMVNPNDFVVGGWDISSKNLAESMERAQVLEYDLQRQLQPWMAEMVPLPSLYYPDFIAANQEDRADNVVPGDDKFAHLEQIRADIRNFKEKNQCDKVIVLWTATTERFSELRAGLNDTPENLMASIKRSDAEVSPSTVFAVASILEGCAYINGSPQNTLVPAVITMAEQHKVFVAGDDFKSGQTKFKSVLVEFLVGAGIKPVAIASYNHLGNNDGKNLSSPAQFRSKEISKKNVVDDMVASNRILYKEGEEPDHCIVIKYIPKVGDSKRAMDEYTSDIFMGGRHTLVVHNTCEDSLLAAPLIIDLVVLAELMQRVQYSNDEGKSWDTFHPVLSILSYFCKAPVVPSETPLVNALFRQKCCIENVLRALVGLAPEDHMLLEYKTALATGPKTAAATH